MPKPALLLVVVAALGLTVFLVLGLLGDGGGEGGGDALDGAPLREAKDGDARLLGTGTGTAADLVRARSADLKIRGRVRDGDGEPLAACRVGVRRQAGTQRDPRDPTTWSHARTPWSERAGREGFDQIDRPLASRFVATRETTTDEDGRFEIAVDRVGRYYVRALVEAPRVSSTALAYLYEMGRTGQVALTVLAGAPLLGRVIDGAGAGVAAVVRGTVDAEGKDSWIADPVETGASDGAFAWPALPPGEGTFTVVVPGRLVLRGKKVTLPHDGLWTIRLDEDGGTVAGSVLDGSGEAVAGARLLVDTGEGLARATSGVDGTYRAEGAPAGEITRVVVEAEGFGTYAETPPLAPWAGASVKAGETTPLDVTLEAGATLEGVVREVGTGRTLAGVEVFVLRRTTERGQPPVPYAQTDAAGRYAIPGLPPGLHVLLARGPTHYLPALAVPQARSIPWTPSGAPLLPGPPPALLLLVTKTDRAVERDLELAPGLTLRGRVVGPDDEPVAGAEVHADQAGLQQVAWRWGGSWPGWGAPLATTGEDGRFAVHSLPPTEALALRASKKPLTSTAPTTVRLAKDEPAEEVLIRLDRGITIEGRLLGPDGQGAQGWINAYSTTGGYGNRAYAATEADGTFRLENLPAGGVHLNVSSEGYGSTRVTLEPVPAGETKRDVEIRLRAGVRVSGILVDQHGNPVPHHGLMLVRPDGGAQITLRTDEEGRFETDHAPRGRLKATITELQGNVGVPVDVGKPFDSPVVGLRLTLSVPERTIVEGTVVDPEGKPVPICRVTISPVVNGRAVQDRRQGFSYVDANEIVNGEFRREVKGEAPFEIEVSSPRGADGAPLNLLESTVRVPDPGAGPVEVRLEPGLELRGRVVDPRGAGVPAVVVHSSSVMTTTDDEGRFRLGGLSGAEVSLDLTPPPGWVKPARRNVALEGEELEIALSPAAAVAGTIRDEAGHTPSGFASVEASWKATGNVPRGSLRGSGMNGAFRLEGIPQGVTVHLVVTIYGTGGGGAGASAPIALDVEAGTLDVEIVAGGGPGVAGVLVDESGRPVASASVSVGPEDGSGRSLWTRTSEDGRFRAAGLEPGAYRVSVMRPGERAAADVFRVTAPTEDARLVLVEPRTIRGRLAGESPGGLRVVAWADGAPGTTLGVQAVTNAGGAFEVEGLGRGRVVLVVQWTRDDRYARSSPLEPGATGVELTLREGARISGTVVDANGKPPSPITVVAHSDTWQATTWCREGKFELRRLPPGTYRLFTRGLGLGQAKGPEVEASTGRTNVQLRTP